MLTNGVSKIRCSFEHKNTNTTHIIPCPVRAPVQGKSKTSLRVTAVTPMSFLSLHTALQQPSTDAQQQCSGPSACPLQQSCCARQVEISFACHCFYTHVFFFSSYSTAATQHRCTTTMLMAPCMLAATELLCTASRTQLCMSLHLHPSQVNAIVVS